MKKILYFFIIISALASCDTPNNVIGNPQSATNTSGTTGSANMTEGNKADSKIIPGTPGDSTVTKKDSIPR